MLGLYNLFFPPHVTLGVGKSHVLECLMSTHLRVTPLTTPISVLTLLLPWFPHSWCLTYFPHCCLFGCSLCSCHLQKSICFVVPLVTFLP